MKSGLTSNVLPTLAWAFALCCLGFGLAPSTPTQVSPRGKPDAVERHIAPVVKKFCIGCHAGLSPAGGISLEKLSDRKSFRTDARSWRRVVRAVSRKSMPPKGVPSPTDKQRTDMVKAIEDALKAAQ